MNSPYTFSISFNNTGLSYGSTSEHIYITNIPVYIGLYMFHMFMHTVAISVHMPLASKVLQMLKTF